MQFYFLNGFRINSLAYKIQGDSIDGVISYMLTIH